MHVTVCSTHTCVPLHWHRIESNASQVHVACNLSCSPVMAPGASGIFLRIHERLTMPLARTCDDKGDFCCPRSRRPDAGAASSSEVSGVLTAEACGPAARSVPMPSDPKRCSGTCTICRPYAYRLLPGLTLACNHA